MVTSNVISKINRSMDDPLLLAADIWAILIDHHPGNPIGPEGVLRGEGMVGTRLLLAALGTCRPLAALGTCRPLAALGTYRPLAALMERSKMSEASVQALTRIAQQAGWQTGPLSAGALLAPKLSLLSSPWVPS